MERKVRNEPPKVNRRVIRRLLNKAWDLVMIQESENRTRDWCSQGIYFTTKLNPESGAMDQIWTDIS
jgi:hypothetical protein